MRVFSYITYEIYADDELRTIALAAFYFCETALTVGVRSLWSDLAVAVARRLLLHRVAGRRRLLVHLLLWRMGVASTGVDRWWHG